MMYAETPATNPQRDRRWLPLCTGILLLGSLLRLVALQNVPPGLAQDEVLNADIVSFIRGGEHAFFFRYGYGHEPLYHYWSVPFQVLLGDNFLSIRLPAVFLGLLLIALTLRWAHRDFGGVAALVTGFGLAVGWWPIVFSRIGLRPIMEPVFLMVAALFWPMLSSTLSRRTIRRAAVSGTLLGLSLYTYTAARVLFALPAIYGLYAWLMSWWTGRQAGRVVNTSSVSEGLTLATRRYRTQAVVAAIALGVMAVASLPLFLTLRADPTLQERVDQLSGPLDALRGGNWQPVAQTTLATLGAFGLTGDPRWTYSLPNRPLFEPVAAILFLFGFGLVLWRWRKPRYAFVLIWLIVALVPSAVTPDAPSSVRLVGAMSLIYLLPGLAVAAGLAGVRQRWPGPSPAPALVATALVSVALLTLGRTIGDGFVRWPAALDTRLKYQSVLLDISRDDHLAGGIPVVADSFYEPIDNATLRRNLNRDPGARWVQTGADFGGAIVWPSAGPDGEPSYLFVPEFTPVDRTLLARAGIGSAPLFRSVEKPSYAVYAISQPPVSDSEPVLYQIDDAVRLAFEGIAGVPEMVGQAATAEIELYSNWQVSGPLPGDLAIFVHLVDGTGEVVAQYDGLDAAAETLRPGDRVLQRHVIPLPMDLSDESFALRLGVYRRSDGARLQTADKRDVIDIATCRILVGTDGRYRLLCDLPDK